MGRKNRKFGDWPRKSTNKYSGTNLHLILLAINFVLRSFLDISAPVKMELDRCICRPSKLMVIDGEVTCSWSYVDLNRMAIICDGVIALRLFIVVLCLYFSKHWTERCYIFCFNLDWWLPLPSAIFVGFSPVFGS